MQNATLEPKSPRSPISPRTPKSINEALLNPIKERILHIDSEEEEEYSFKRKEAINLAKEIGIDVDVFYVSKGNRTPNKSGITFPFKSPLKPQCKIIFIFRRSDV
jgi:hypothetical protein